MGLKLAALSFAVLLSAPTTALEQNDGSERTHLDEFVFSEESLSQFSFFHAEDFDFEAVNPITGGSYRAYILNMTSGEWRTGISSVNYFRIAQCVKKIFHRA